MTDRLQIKDHLRNEALYQSGAESSLGVEWKQRLIRRLMFNRQLAAALRERQSLFKPFVWMSIPLLSVFFSLASYLGYIHPERWHEDMAPALSAVATSVNPMEVLLLVAIVNGLAFLWHKRLFAL